MNGLQSVLAQPIADFLQYKQALNKKYQTETMALRLFDRYLFEQSVTGWPAITSGVINAFMATRPRHRPRSYNHLLGVLRRFFDWAVLQRWINQNPVVERSKRETGKRLPYLFDLTMARRLLEIARGLPDTPKGPQRALVYETVFALLYGLGLRVGEVARLTVGDVDLLRQVLCIRETKFSKNRLVPFGPNMAHRLKQYCEQRYGVTATSETPLFSFTQGHPIHPCTISQTFHKLLPQLDFRLPAGVSSPRVHDLRHSFAVGTLLRWYREGIDPNQRLMHLATFLGHVDPNSTEVYLRLTDELLREADQRFYAFAQPGDLQ